MIRFLRNSLFSLLVLLQLIAPLSHAHSGQEIGAKGIHLPGLELLINDHDSISKQLSTTSEKQGVLISVSRGIGQTIPDINLSSDAFSYQHVGDNHCVLFSFLNIKPTDTDIDSSRLLLTTSPRAPPLGNSQ